MDRPRICVNVDHVATLRQARRTDVPDPVAAAMLCELAGADGIVAHLREDRRHISDRDLRLLRQSVKTQLNLEMGATDEMIAIAAEVQPDWATLVPERREELTTEGGLDVAGAEERLAKAVDALKASGVRVSLFIDPSAQQIEASARVGADAVELHTGAYAENWRTERGRSELSVLSRARDLARQRGLVVNAGHGLTYRNVRPIAQLGGLHELNIGHDIMARAILAGMQQAVREMVDLCAEAWQSRRETGARSRD
jgi:pyridoxine 5-phosphate synthase